MSNRAILNIILLAMVIGLTVFITYDPKQESKAMTTLGGPANMEITDITLKRDGLEDVLFQRQHMQWRMLKPYQVSAAPERINALLELPSAVSHNRFSSIDKDLGVYHLAEPKAELTLNKNQYQFGNSERLSNHRYVLHDNTIHLTTDRFFHHLRTSPIQFVSRNILDTGMRIKSIDLPTLKITKSSDGHWQTAPGQAPDVARHQSIENLVDHWRTLRANQVKTIKTPAEVMDITLTLESGRKMKFGVRQTEDELILICNPQGIQFHFDGENANKLLSLTSSN